MDFLMHELSNDGNEHRNPISIKISGPRPSLENRDGFILISHCGKKMVGYKKLRRLDQKRVAVNLIRPEELSAYLIEAGAELVCSAI